MKILFVCLVLTLYITNAYGLNLKPICVDSDLCEKANKEAKYIEYWIDAADKYQLKYSSPFDENSDYEVKEDKFFMSKYTYTPKLRYSKYLSKRDTEICEKRSWVDLFIDVNLFSNITCDALFYHLKEQKEQTKCERAWQAWTELSTKGYITNEHPDVTFLEMIKKEFHENLLYVNKLGFIFKFDELDQNLDCYPFMDDSSLCHSLFNRCNEDHEKSNAFVFGVNLKEGGAHTTGEHSYDEKVNQYKIDMMDQALNGKWSKRGVKKNPYWISPDDEEKSSKIHKMGYDKSSCHENDVCGENESINNPGAQCSAFKVSSDVDKKPQLLKTYEQIVKNHDYICKKKQIDGFIFETISCYDTLALDLKPPVIFRNQTIHSWFEYFLYLLIKILVGKMIFDSIYTLVVYLFKKIIGEQQPNVNQNNNESEVIDSYILINDILNQQNIDPYSSEEEFKK